MQVHDHGLLTYSAWVFSRMSDLEEGSGICPIILQESFTLVTIIIRSWIPIYKPTFLRNDLARQTPPCCISSINYTLSSCRVNELAIGIYSTSNDNEHIDATFYCSLVLCSLGSASDLNPASCQTLYLLNPVPYPDKRSSAGWSRRLELVM